MPPARAILAATILAMGLMYLLTIDSIQIVPDMVTVNPTTEREDKLELPPEGTPATELPASPPPSPSPPSSSSPEPSPTLAPTARSVPSSSPPFTCPDLSTLNSDTYLSRTLPENILRPVLPSPAGRPIQIGVLGGSYTLGIRCALDADQDFPCGGDICYPCAWPGRLQTLLNAHFPGAFNVINLSVSASCSGCMAPVLANKLSDSRIEGGVLDVMIHDLSVNDANTKRPNT